MVRQLSNGPHLVTTSPSSTACRRCKRPMLAATVGGIDRHVDPTALTDEGELAALIAGCKTYELRGELLIRRGPDRLARPHPDVPVLADHTCRTVLPEHVDHSHLYRAMALVASSLGATLVSDTGHEPPF